MNIEYLIEKYSNLVYKICIDMLSSPEEAEDKCQESYISLYINFEKYKDLTENEYKNLICKIALNKSKDYLKSKQLKKEEALEQNIIQFEDLKSEAKLDYNLIENEKTTYIQNTIHSLNEPYRTLVYEHCINEKSLDELSLQMHCTKGTLKTQLHRGKKILKNKLEKVRR